MKVFRKITQVIIVAIIVIAAHSCYKDDVNHHYRIPFKNDADYFLYILSESKEQYFMSPHYQDTILQSYYCDPSKDTLNHLMSPHEEDESAFFQMTCYEAQFGYEFDTLLVFIFDADTLDFYGWDSVRASYKVVQRYDLSLEDLQSIGFKLCFPPSDAMKHIHMWPPYGTYDENGNCRTIK